MSIEHIQNAKNFLKKARGEFAVSNFTKAKQLATHAFAAADAVCIARCKEFGKQAKQIRSDACDIQDASAKKMYLSGRGQRKNAGIVRLQDVMAIAPSSISESGSGIYAGNGRQGIRA